MWTEIYDMVGLDIIQIFYRWQELVLLPDTTEQKAMQYFLKYREQDTRRKLRLLNRETLEIIDERN